MSSTGITRAPKIAKGTPPSATGRVARLTVTKKAPPAR